MASIWDLLDAIPRREDVSPEELAARRQGYADLYAGGFLSRNKDEDPMSVRAMQASQDFIPGIGDAIAFGEAGQALSEGNRRAAALLAAGGLLGVVPGAGDALARPVIAAGRKVANAIPSDVMYAGRSLAEGDMRGVLDAFTPGRPVQGLGADAVKPGIDLWHGSPYDFRNFDMDMIGKGEGAQDLGRGFSLTDEQAVAHAYMNPASRWGDLEAMERYRQAGPGRTYQVNLDAAPEQILDWKKPWKSQVPENTPLYDAIQRRLGTIYTDDPDMQKLYQQADLGSVWREGIGLEDAAMQSGFVGNQRQNFSGDTEFTVFDPSKMNIAKVFDNEGREMPLSAMLPPARTLAQEQARNILEMRAAGRASEVTDEMMAAADPEYMYFNTPLPMDEASRMARASDVSAYHGTDRDFTSFDPQRFGEKDPGWYGRGVTSDTDPEVAAGYADYNEAEAGQQIMPVRLGGRYMDWPEGQLPFGNPKDSMVGTRDMQALGYSGSKMTNDRDLYGVTPEWGTEYVTFDPRNVRSIFARFDPEFAHLRNLSAGVGGAGLLSMGYPQEEQY